MSTGWDNGEKDHLQEALPTLSRGHRELKSRRSIPINRIGQKHTFGQKKASVPCLATALQHSWTCFWQATFHSWTWLLQVDNNFKTCCIVTIIAIVKIEDSYYGKHWVKRKRSLPCNMLLCCWHALGSNEGIPKAASLFERHLNIDLVSLYKREGTKPVLKICWQRRGKSDVAMTR